MIEQLDATVLWWHWIVLGMILFGLELFVGNFLMMGLGTAAMLVGVGDTLFDTSLTQELLLWALLMTAFVIVWKRYFKEPKRSSLGQSDYGMDTIGTVTSAIHPPQRGTVVFDEPFMGNSEWPAKADAPIEAGIKVAIKKISGQLIEVTPKGD